MPITLIEQMFPNFKHIETYNYEYKFVLIILVCFLSVPVAILPLNSLVLFFNCNFETQKYF